MHEDLQPRRGSLRESAYADIDELKLLIVHNLDVYEFLDILGVSFAELVDRYEEECEEQYEELARACR